LKQVADKEACAAACKTGKRHNDGEQLAFDSGEYHYHKVYEKHAAPNLMSSLRKIELREFSLLRLLRPVENEIAEPF